MGGIVMNKQEIRDEISTLKDRISEHENTLKEPKYKDLELPSGTLWATENEEGYFTFDEAVEKYGDSLPARWQFCELIDCCECIFDDEKKALVCKSKFNGNMVELPASGFRGSDSEELYGVGLYSYYWSCSPYSDGCAWCLYFHHYGDVLPASVGYHSGGQAVRCCKLNR